MFRPAGGLRRTSYATSAVGATLLALISLLGVSVLVAKETSGNRTSTLVAGDPRVTSPAASNRSSGSAAAPGAGSSGARTSGAGAAGAPRVGNGSGVPSSSAHAPSAPVELTPSSAGSPPPATTPGSGSGSGSGSTGAANTGSVPAASERPQTTMPVRTAKGGDWSLRVESRAKGTLLGEPDSGDGHLRATDAASDGSQRFDAQNGPSLGTFGGYATRVVSQGRYLTEVELAGETGPGRRFVAAVPVLDVPSTWRPGDRWSWKLTSDDTKTVVDAAFSVVGRETATLHDGSTHVDTVHLHTTLTLSGDRSLTVERDVWFSPSLGVPVRIEEHTTGTDTTGAAVDRTSTIELTATEPGSGSSVVPTPAAV